MDTKHVLFGILFGFPFGFPCLVSFLRFPCWLHCWFLVGLPCLVSFFNVLFWFVSCVFRHLQHFHLPLNLVLLGQRSSHTLFMFLRASFE